MLPKEKRLRAERDIKRVYQKGSFFSMKNFNINYVPNRLNLSRLAIVVNKKTAAKAVARNEVKRRLREIFRSLYDKLPTGYDVIVNVKREALGAKREDLLVEAQKTAEKVGQK
jgi:ribonuclease P protein component